MAVLEKIASCYRIGTKKVNLFLHRNEKTYEMQKKSIKSAVKSKFLLFFLAIMNLQFTNPPKSSKAAAE